MIHKLIPQCNKIIWSDVDVLFQGDLQEIYDTNLEGYFWAGVAESKNTPLMHQYTYFEENKNPYMFYSGFMIINSEKMRKDDIWERFCTVISKHYSKIRFFDLEILNICCNPIKRIPIEYCMTEAIYSFDNFDDSNEWKLLQSVYSKDELIKAKKPTKIIHYNENNFPRIWERVHKQIPDYYWNFLEKSPFFNRSNYERTLLRDITYVLQYIGAKILPVRRWRKKLRKSANAYHQKFIGSK